MDGQRKLEERVEMFTEFAILEDTLSKMDSRDQNGIGPESHGAIESKPRLM